MDVERRSVKLLITYDPVPELREAYFNFVLGEFVPRLEHLGLKMSESWHTAYGPYPLRLLAFTAPDEAMEDILASDVFSDLEDRLKEYVRNYNRRTVLGRNRFQF